MAQGLTPRMLNHLAYVTHDVAATADFYTRILGMELASTIFDDQVPSTGENFPYFHIFFRMADGSTIAFFECTDLPPAAKSTHPAYDTFNHVPPPTTGTTIDPQQRAWLEQNGYVVGGSGGGPAATGQATVGDRLRGFVTNTRFKAILDPVAPPDQQLRMYKVDVDPEEVHDISGDPEQRDKVDKARAMLLRAARQ